MYFKLLNECPKLVFNIQDETDVHSLKNLKRVNMDENESSFATRIVSCINNFIWRLKERNEKIKKNNKKIKIKIITN